MAMSYETDVAKKFKAQFSSYVLQEIENQGYDAEVNATQHFYCDCIFYFDRMDKDPNNYYKLLWDSITSTQKIWMDDNVVAERCQGIFYDRENPRIEIWIHPVEYVGVFKDGEALSAFSDRCKTCRRYVRNCSLLRNARLGVIQRDIDMDNGGCVKYRQYK